LRARETGSRRPFFFLYPEFTTTFYGLSLSRHLGDERPFYIIHPHGFDGSPIPLNIEDMAAQNLKLIRAVQPEGPYLLGARCAAGTETFELARQLRADGQQVDQLLLIDSEIPPYKGTWLPRLRRVSQRMRLREIQQRWLYLKLSQSRQKYAGDRTVDERDLCYWWAFDSYKPRRYDGEVTLFLSEEWMTKRYDQVVGGWYRLADRVVVQGVGGTHLSCVTDYAWSLGAELGSRLSGVG
jgi:thioesterase domain-containing protein